MHVLLVVLLASSLQGGVNAGLNQMILTLKSKLTTGMKQVVQVQT